MPDFDHWLASRKQPVYLISEKSKRTNLEQLATERHATVDELDAKHVGALLPPPGAY